MIQPRVLRRPSFPPFPSLLSLLSLFLLLPALAKARGAEQDPRPAGGGERCFLWKITSPTTTVHLLGSIHVGQEDFYPLPKEIEEAFAGAQHLVVEVDIGKTDQAKLGALMEEKGRYAKEDALSKNLSPETLDKLKAYCAKSGVPLAALEKTKPWVVALTITMLEAQKLGLKPDLGIDKHFLNAAKDKMDVLELESMEFQLNLLSGFSNELQEKFLVSSLEEVENMKEDLGKMVGAWKNGDAKALEDLLTKSVRKHPELAPVWVKVNDERNGPMAQKIESYLKGKEQHFVVVGAAHLVGEKGLVQLLSAKQFKVEQVAASGVRSAVSAPVAKPHRESAPTPEKTTVAPVGSPGHE